MSIGACRAHRLFLASPRLLLFPASSSLHPITFVQKWARQIQQASVKRVESLPTRTTGSYFGNAASDVA